MRYIDTVKKPRVRYNNVNESIRAPIQESESMFATTKVNDPSCKSKPREPIILGPYKG